MTERAPSRERHEAQTLKGKNVVIMGASSGLGHALAEQLSQEGCNLYLLSRSIESTQLPFEAKTFNCDAQYSSSVEYAFRQIDEVTDKVDVLVNCTGIGLVKDLEKTGAAEAKSVIDTNLTGAIYTATEAYKRMLPNESGHIINVVSTSGMKARPDETVYCASKWGLRGFTDSLREAAAPHHIRVTGVYPGGMQTNFWKGNEPRNLQAFMEPADIAREIVHVMKTPPSISPKEVVIERGV